MDTSISVEHKSYADLVSSDFQEEKELAKKLAEVVYKIMAEIKPVLKYVSQPIPLLHETEHRSNGRTYTRGVEIDSIEHEPGGGITHVFLLEDGRFLGAKACNILETPADHLHYHYSHSVTQDGSPWKLIPLEKLVEQLQGIFKVATEKREKHLSSIRERAQKLDSILAILKPSPR